MISELARVVTRVADGAPPAELVPFVAPIAPEPLVPELSTPSKPITVMEAITLADRVALTAMLFNGEGAKARHISEPPLRVFVLKTRTQVNPPPLTLFTVVLGGVR